MDIVDKVDKFWTRVQTMAQYALRMDYDRSADRGTLSDYLASNSSRYLVVFETAEGENPHVHAIFYSEKKLAALRKAFQRAFPSKNGNGSYSMKACDEKFEDYIAYMCKGASREDPPVVELRQGLDYTDAAIESAHGRYWVNNDAIMEARRARSVKLDIVEAVEKVAKENGVRSHERAEVAKIYIRMKKAQKKGINLFQARAVVNTVCVLLDDTGVREEELALEIARF